MGIWVFHGLVHGKASLTDGAASLGGDRNPSGLRSRGYVGCELCSGVHREGGCRHSSKVTFVVCAGPVPSIGTGVPTDRHCGMLVMVGDSYGSMTNRRRAERFSWLG